MKYLLLLLLSLFGCQENSYESGSSLILQSQVSLDDEEFIKNDKELVLFYPDSTAIFINPDYGIINRSIIVINSDSIKIGNKAYAIVKHTDDWVKLKDYKGAEATFLKLDNVDPSNFVRSNQYSIYTDDFIIRMGTSLDTIHPHKVPVEISNYDSTYYQGFINVRQFGERNEILHSELFTLVTSRFNGQSILRGYILDRFIDEDYDLTIESSDNVNFRTSYLPDMEYLNTRSISRELFLSEELSHEGWGMEVGTNSSSKISYLDMNEVVNPKLLIDSGKFIFMYGDAITDLFSRSVSSSFSNNYFLKNEITTKGIRISPNKDSIFTFNTYRFRLDNSIEIWYRRDTFKRTDVNLKNASDQL